MREFTYSPPEETGFSGTVIVAMPNYRERIALARENEGLIDEKDDEEKDKFAASQFMLDLAEKHVQECDLVHVASGEKITKFDDVGCFAGGSRLINHIASQVIHGIELGEASPQQSE